MRPRPADHPSVIARFLSYIEVTPQGCHIWTGGRSRGGDRYSDKAFYGTFNPGGEVKGGIRAHVFIAWIRGKIPSLKVPAGMNLDHTCVNALCVNANHLELIPKLENQRRKNCR